jgi:acetyl-CoA acetyltransferase
VTGSVQGGAAIVGIGATEFSKAAGRSETQLACEAITAALADAGLGVADIDGLVTYTIDPVEEAELVRGLGFPDVAWSSRVPYGGAGSQATLVQAAAAVSSRAARAVVVWRAVKARSGRRFGSAAVPTSPTSSHSGSTAAQWSAPYGALTPASWIALLATRYMDQYGVTSEDFGRAVVQLRAHAATNPMAHYFGRPLTLDEHQASRWIAEPCIRRADCCQESDGAVALVVVPADQAVSTSAPTPVRIVAATGAALNGHEVASDHYSPDVGDFAESRALGNRLFAQAGLTRADIDVALVYDAFTPVLLMQIEALGFCGPGQAKDLIGDAGLGLTGALPCNPNGGLIGEAYIHGLNLTLEAVRQLRGTAVNQVPGARTALVAATRSGVLLGT